MAGRRLADRYELTEVVAKGGMGVVWRARDLRLDRPVAVKLVTALADPTMAERFDREARTVARLNHPNIVAIYDFGADGGDSFLVMEFVEGRSLAAVIRDGPLPIAETVAVAAHACAGLAAAHAAGVVHRDVKPANLIRTPSGIVKICDFGIARLQHQAGLTGTAIAMGSTSYMAPEQVNGEQVDARTDLYGLGCTIHAMLTGAPPFVGETPLAVVHQHVTAPPPDVRSARPDVPEPLASLVAELLAKSPDDRPGDASAVAARLAGLGAVDAPTVWPRRRRRRVLGVAAGGVAALAAIVLLVAATTDGAPTTVTAPPPTSAGAPTASPVPAPAATRSVGPVRTTGAPVVLPPPTPTTTRPAPSASAPRTPTRPPDPIAGLHRTIDQQVATRQLAPKTADDLRRRVDEIGRKVADGDEPGAAKKIRELRTRLVDLRDQGKLGEAGYAALVRDLDRLIAPAA